MSNQKHLLLYGVVQGVNLRYLIQNEANRRKICGFVKNSSDGSVEVLAIGEARELDNLILWISMGPGQSKIKEIKKISRPSMTKFDDFQILY